MDEGNSDSLFYSNGEPVLDTEGRPVTEEEYKAFYNGVMDEIEAGINEERSQEGLPPLEETEIYPLYQQARILCEDPSLCTQRNIDALRGLR